MSDVGRGRKAVVSSLEDWAGAVRGELGLGEGTSDTGAVLDLARIVAHTVDRPAAPLTAYLVGIAVGRGQPLADAVARVTALARSWPSAAEQ
jgi:Domain of unknown function (DUF6457)